MQYTEITIFTTSIGADLVVDKLSEMGFDGFTVEDGADIEALLREKDHYWWDYVDESVLAMRGQEPNVKLYVQAGEDEAQTIRDVEAALSALREESQGVLDVGRLALKTRTVDDEEWKDKWKEYFKPVHITRRIVVKPTWESYTAKPDEIVIEIDPGRAFGTGAHPTTAMCVRLLETYLAPGPQGEPRESGAAAQGEQSAQSVLDVGCGSGILSVAASLLGARRVTAVDIDPLAVEVTAENAQLNAVRDKLDIYQGDLTKGLAMKAEIVVANLMAELIVTLSGSVKQHLKSGGIFISSGILTEKREMVEQALISQGFTVAKVLEEDGWCALAASL